MTKLHTVVLQFARMYRNKSGSRLAGFCLFSCSFFSKKKHQKNPHKIIITWCWYVLVKGCFQLNPNDQDATELGEDLFEMDELLVAEELQNPETKGNCFGKSWVNGC